MAQGSFPDADPGAGGNDSSSEAAGGRDNGGSRQGFMERFDTDGDGRISKSEFQGPDDFFSRFDANGDGYVSEDEAPQGRPSGSATEGGRQMMSGSESQGGGPLWCCFLLKL